MLKKFDKATIIIFITAFLGAYLLFPPYFDMHVYPMSSSPEYNWLTLDPSWTITLNYANLKELVWGEEFVFTYGPLSYLSTRFGWGVNKMDFLLYDLFVFFNFFFIFFFSIKRATKKIFPVLLVFLTCLILPDFFRGANSIVLLIFLIFWLKLSMLNPKWYYFLPQFVLLFLMFYIKFNTGLVSFILFYSGLLYLFFNSNVKKVYLFTVGITPLILIVLSAPLFNVKLWPYILNGIEMVKGYNQIMYLDRAISDYHLFAILIILIILFLFFKIFHREKKQNLHYNLTIFFLISSVIYVLFKQGFVRADKGHITDFYIYICLILLVSYTYFNLRFKKILNPLLIICFVISGYFTFAKNKTSIDFKLKFIKSQYVDGFNNFTPTSGVKLFPNNNQLPVSIKKRIGKKTVDIFPWNSYLLFENKMNFSPRPVFQSYTAYTKKLEELNFAYYNSTKAPQFVLYDYDSIDYRYPLYDESKVNLAITMNYEVVDTFSIQNRKMLLLEKKKEFKPVKLLKSKEYAKTLGSKFVPQKNIFYEVEVYSSILGKFVSLTHHSPELSVIIQTSNKKEYKHRTSQNLLKSGFFLNIFIDNTTSFLNIFNNEKTNEILKINNIRFSPRINNFYKNKINVVEYIIVQ